MVLFAAAVGLAVAGVAGMVVLARGGTLIPHRSTQRARRGASMRELRVGAVAVIAAVAAVAATRWVAAGLAAFAVVLLWPRIMGGGAVGRAQLTKIEAIAAWTEALRDSASAASGLEQAIPATVSSAPPLLGRPLRDLNARLQGRVPLPEALARFADDLDDPAADMVVAALSLNARQRAGGLQRILTALAATARNELEMRRKVEHQRRSVRRQAMQIVSLVLGFIALQLLFAPGWVRPYGGLLGQLVLVILAGIFVATFARMRSLAAPETPERFLTSAEEITEIASYKPQLRLG